ncbi:CopG family ribbon-helix-helix protein [Methermicoccus shengliensis]|uniref:CopG family ribbon-helix-helix protein n=1 Tax=Methermicoccus shengliensis TaxID=660064 RepID=A0A832RSM1_9EURY|nr:CopG family ribbon-helix-helix protein [Methermicoccus shengliensis]KUK05062.1 MAG: Putative nickel responsive regulator 1 [Euryarchaeota archaeon 55_53]KUK30355.1 MAG: Putative nickel responsive regulator 1 [Methanosarcinales archeaon 56_1174]MDI3487554.1 CopG family transcriptional regulator, nickel-responsive regulator [Methanosarcinales archaeon]MDN5294703.1 CopG family transcriptional regulator, nickel-responsive regulator [Methanosarcinales archaeon]HIH69415.1 CopG family ribbon-helix
MSKIISISMSEELLDGIDRIQRELGFSGRSEVIRAGIRMLMADSRERERLTGDISSILLLVHAQNVEDTVTEIKHQFEEVVSTHVHHHLREDKCLEILILSGDARRIKRLVEMFQTTGKMEYIKLIVP